MISEMPMSSQCERLKVTGVNEAKTFGRPPKRICPVVRDVDVDGTTVPVPGTYVPPGFVKRGYTTEVSVGVPLTTNEPLNPDGVAPKLRIPATTIVSPVGIGTFPAVTIVNVATFAAQTALVTTAVTVET
jgi:hypothetical protein